MGPRQPSGHESPCAYIVKVRSDASPDTLMGRLENVVTGQSHRFASSDELLRLIAKDLAAIVEAKP